MKIGDTVYIVRNKAPQKCRVVAHRGDSFVVDDGEEFHWIVQSSNYAPCFTTKVEACLSEAEAQRKQANKYRKDAAEKLASAEECETAAAGLLKTAHAELRKDSSNA